MRTKSWSILGNFVFLVVYHAAVKTAAFRKNRGLSAPRIASQDRASNRFCSASGLHFALSIAISALPSEQRRLRLSFKAWFYMQINVLRSLVMHGNDGVNSCVVEIMERLRLLPLFACHENRRSDFPAKEPTDYFHNTLQGVPRGERVICQTKHLFQRSRTIESCDANVEMLFDN